MEETRKIAKLNYQTTQHHRQILRSQIDQNLVDKIQISQHPSQNYRQAYKNLFADQLEKSIHQHDLRKMRDQVQKQAIKNSYYSQQKNSKYEPSSTQIGKMMQQPCPKQSYYDQILQEQQNNKQTFIDYYKKRDEKFQSLISKNLLGGNAIQKNYENSIKKRMLQTNSLQHVLKDQLNYKDYCKKLQIQKKNQQNQCFLRMKQHQKQLDIQKAQYSQNQKQKFRSSILKQIQEQKIKKSKKTFFQYDNIARHNPITNPIEYHIQNPYILKKIQDKQQLITTKYQQNNLL